MYYWHALFLRLNIKLIRVLVRVQILILHIEFEVFHFVFWSGPFVVRSFGTGKGYSYSIWIKLISGLSTLYSIVMLDTNQFKLNCLWLTQLCQGQFIFRLSIFGFFYSIEEEIPNNTKLHYKNIEFFLQRNQAWQSHTPSILNNNTTYTKSWWNTM